MLAHKSLCQNKSKSFSSYITTNGSLLTIDVLEKLKFNTIQLTFDGDVKYHEKYKVAKNFGYNNLLNLVNIVLKHSNSKLKIRFNICKENASGFKTVIDDVFALPDFDVNRISFMYRP